MKTTSKVSFIKKMCCEAFCPSVETVPNNMERLLIKCKGKSQKHSDSISCSTGKKLIHTKFRVRISHLKPLCQTWDVILGGAPTTGLLGAQEWGSCSPNHRLLLLQWGQKLHTAPRLPTLRPRLGLQLELPHRAAAAAQNRGVTRSHCPTSRATPTFETSLDLSSTNMNIEVRSFISTHSERSKVPEQTHSVHKVEVVSYHLRHTSDFKGI